MEYGTPHTLGEAVARLGETPATILAGGTDLYPQAAPGTSGRAVLDITAIPELRGVSRTQGGFRIGAATTWSDIAGASGLPPAFRALREAALRIGGAQIQNAGTIGGNLCNASPAADGVPALLVLDAEVELASARGARRLALGDFITGPRSTALRSDELLTAILLPDPAPGAQSAFEKLGSRAYLVISVAMVAALVRTGTGGIIEEARVAAGACSPVARRLETLETDLAGQHPSAIRIDENHLADLAPIGDPRGSASYRMDAVRELVLRAVARAGEQHG